MTLDRREHRYLVIRADGSRSVVMAVPSELHVERDPSEVVTIVDETAAAEWMPEWRTRVKGRDNTGAVLGGGPVL